MVFFVYIYVNDLSMVMYTWDGGDFSKGPVKTKLFVVI